MKKKFESYRFVDEIRDLKIVGEIGDRWGYGNCIQYLQEKWAESLMGDGMDAITAAISARMTGDDVKNFAKGYRLPK